MTSESPHDAATGDPAAEPRSDIGTDRPGAVSASQLERLGDYRVLDDDDDDPVLVSKDGQPVDTWREGYPYRERVSRPDYERDKRLLQIELLKLQNWVKTSGERVVVLFE